MTGHGFNAEVSALKGHVDGRVLTSDDAGWQAAAAAWNVAYQHRPAVVVEAASVADVARTVGFATANGLSIAVQTTGHGVGTPAGADAVLLVTRSLDTARVDADEAVAIVGGGATWAPVLEAAQDAGLAPLLGSSPHTGAVGYTLGGGFGWLGRRYGLAAHHVRSLQVVLADGSVVRASEESEPELFWALRGAGMGSLGVVVEMEIGLVPVRSVYGGNLFYPIDGWKEAFDRYITWSDGLPDEFTTAFDIFNFPPLDMIPGPLRGRAFAVIRGAHCGDPAEAKALVDEWRAWGQPEIDLFGPMPFREVAAIAQDPTEPIPALTSARWLSGLATDVGAAMFDAVLGGTGPSPVLFAETRHGGDAVSRPAGPGQIVPDAERLLQVVAVTPDPDARRDAERRTADLWQTLSPRVSGAYLNLTEGEERVSQARDAFDAASWSRLADIKRRFDPLNAFSHGLDIFHQGGNR
jgi:FAD/FMN-containing dehydrogenase